MQDFSAGDVGQVVAHEVGMPLCDVPDRCQDTFPDVRMPAADHGSLLSNHIFVGLAEHGEVNGIAGNFYLDILHCGAVGEVGGGENGRGDEGKSEKDFQNRFHGGLPFLDGKWA